MSSPRTTALSLCSKEGVSDQLCLVDVAIKPQRSTVYCPAKTQDNNSLENDEISLHSENATGDNTTDVWYNSFKMRSSLATWEGISTLVRVHTYITNIGVLVGRARFH
jgi:hypothetical protein